MVRESHNKVKTSEEISHRLFSEFGVCSIFHVIWAIFMTGVTKFLWRRDQLSHPLVTRTNSVSTPFIISLFRLNWKFSLNLDSPFSLHSFLRALNTRISEFVWITEINETLRSATTKKTSQRNNGNWMAFLLKLLSISKSTINRYLLISKS